MEQKRIILAHPASIDRGGLHHHCVIGSGITLNYDSCYA